jgi:hypothetical protein
LFITDEGKEKLKQFLYFNYDLHLIIVLGSIKFLHIYDFLVFESFPRVSCRYPASSWKNPPFFYKEGADALDMLHNISILYHKFLYSTNPDDDTINKLLGVLDKMPFAKEYLLKSVIKDKKKKLDTFFRKINNDVLIAKYDTIYQD